MRQGRGVKRLASCFQALTGKEYILRVHNKSGEIITVSRQWQDWQAGSQHWEGLNYKDKEMA